MRNQSSACDSFLMILCALCVASAPSSAREPSHGFAYFGELKYPKGFAHFDYANPDAPKGGTLKTSPVLGTFNNLHSYVDKGRTAVYADTRLGAMMYDRLMTKAEDELASYYGVLAESIEVADDYSWVAADLPPENAAPFKHTKLLRPREQCHHNPVDWVSPSL